jgi:dihydrofolate synthase/folylpolyglutamate synthase
MQSLKSTEYDEMIKTLFSRVAMRRTDLSVIETLLEKWQSPQHSFPSIHVAGTNGKGSVSRKIAAALQSAGYRVGLYVSPHLVDYEERITINGKKIPKEKVMQYYARIDDSAPNFFECSTCFCFQYFKEQEVDIAVIEAGMGGKLDATNVITPILSIITSISFDHTEYLGDTLDKIAAQKAGIIKRNIPVVLGPRVKFKPIFDRAKEMDAQVTVVNEISPYYEVENNAVAREALELLNIAEEDIEIGLQARMPCRFERRGNFIYDVAHNPDGFTRLCEALPDQTFHFIIGISRRKDIKGCLQAIEHKIKHVHFVSSGREDAATVQELGAIFKSISNRPYSLESDIQTAIENVPNELSVICGSFYIMAEALHSKQGSPSASSSKAEISSSGSLPTESSRFC